MTEINGFEIEIYNQYGFRDRDRNATCPKCSEERKKKNDKCLSIFWDTGLARCNHCGELLQLHTFKKKEEIKNFKIPPFKYSAMSAKAIKWFGGRGISQQTLSALKVTDGKSWMPQTKKEENTIQFNYFLNDKIVNVKHRDGRKNFKLFKDAEKIFYNIDSIRTSDVCVIVEGEIDCLSFVEDGVYDVVSVPNGFNLKGSVSISYLDDYLEFFDNKEKIYLCLDNDPAGRKGRDEFIRRLGPERCFLVDLTDSKDANEYLVKNGKTSLKTALKQSKQVPLENVKTLLNFSKELDNFWINGLPKGMLTGMNLFDNVFSAEMGQYTLISGVPQSGKSEWLDQMIVMYNLKTKNKVGIVSIENEPFIFHYDKLTQKILGRKPRYHDIGTEELNTVKEYIDKNYFHVHFEYRYNLQEVLKKFRELVKRKGCRIFVIDPFNKIKLEGMNGNINDYTSEYHLLLDEFVKQTNSHLFLVAHPNKTLQAEGSDSSYKMPNAYDIKGGGEHFDMSYNVIGINRIYEQKIVHVKTLKVKFKHLGEQQKSVFFGYNRNNGRYVDLQSQPKNIDFYTVINPISLDDSNWLSESFKNTNKIESHEQIENEDECPF